MANEKLKEVLKTISVDNEDVLKIGALQREIKDKCPGYEVKLFDYYEGYPGPDYAKDVGQFIIGLHNRHIGEVQIATWTTDCDDFKIVVVIYEQPRYDIIKHETKDYWYIWDNEADAQVCEPDGDPWHFDSLEEAEEWVEDMMS